MPHVAIRMPAVVAMFLALPLLVLSACSSEPEDDRPSVTTSNDVTVRGEASEEPTISIPDDDPSDKLVTDVLEEGDGKKVKSGDFMIAHYVGQTWKSEDGEPNVFDNSWERGAASGFIIGEKQVIAGWDEGLVGQKVGSRVALTIPPDQAYGDTSRGTIPKNSTLVFVVDIIDSIDPSNTAKGKAVKGVSSELPQVKLSATGVPSLDFAGTTAPTKSDSTVVVEGSGEKLRDNIVVNMTQAAYPKGAEPMSTWNPQEVPIVLTADQIMNIPGFAQALTDQKVGTRVVSRIAAADNPKQDGSEGSPLGLVIDVIGTF